MRVLVLLLLPLMSASLVLKNRMQKFPFEALLKSGTGEREYHNSPQLDLQPHYEERTYDNPPSLAGVVLQVPYEQQIYDLVENADVIRCTTLENSNNERSSTEDDSGPCVIRMQPSSMKTERLYDVSDYKAIGQVFHFQLSEAILKVAESLLNTFDEPADSQQNRSQKKESGHSRTQNSSQQRKRPHKHRSQKTSHKNKVMKHTDRSGSEENNSDEGVIDCFYI